MTKDEWEREVKGKRRTGRRCKSAMKGEEVMNDNDYDNNNNGKNNNNMRRREEEGEDNNAKEKKRTKK